MLLLLYFQLSNSAIQTRKCRNETKNFPQKQTMQLNSLFALCSTVCPPGPDKGELYRISHLFTHSTCKLETANGIEEYTVHVQDILWTTANTQEKTFNPEFFLTQNDNYPSRDRL